jgi:hypothetical protein
MSTRYRAYQRRYQRALYLECCRLGICVRCHKAAAQPERVCCAACASALTQTGQAWRARQKAHDPAPEEPRP